MSKYPQFRSSAHAVVAAATLSLNLVLAGSPVQAGPVVNAKVHLFDRNGGLIDGRIGNPFSNYPTALPSSIPFPVRVQMFDGSDLDVAETGVLEHLLPARTGQPSGDSAGPEVDVP